MEGECAVIYDVAQNDVVYVTLGRKEVGMCRCKRDPLILYFLVASFLARKFSEMIGDLSRRAQLIAHHYDIPHLGSDVECVVVAL